jgi:hypothetical protein
VSGEKLQVVSDATEPDVCVSGEKLQVVSDATEPDVCVSGEKLQVVSDATEPDVYVSGEKLQVVSDVTEPDVYVSVCLCVKQALKVIDRKPNSHHHCYILRKHELPSWETLVQYTDACLVFKILNSLAPPPPLSTSVKQTTQTYGSRSTRSAMRGDCIVALRKSTFSKSVFSVRASHVWNTLPSDTQLHHISHFHKMHGHG